MKRALIFVMITVAIGLFSFKEEILNNSPIYDVNYFANLQQSLDELDNTATKFNRNEVSVEALQNIFIKTRLEYKKVEFLLAFHFPEYVNSNINGAPLLKIEKETSQAVVIEPEGLQVLDEMIFSDNPIELKNEIFALTKKLKNAYDQLYKKIGIAELDNEYSIAAMRLQLVRIFTLGLTGFDTPGSINAIDDAKSSLNGMHFYFKANFKDYPDKVKNEINGLFDGAILFLNNSSSFETLDRLKFLKNYCDPLYNLLGTLQNYSNSEFLIQSTPWNPNSKSIFAEDFLNPYYFTLLKKEDDNVSLNALGKELFNDAIISNDGKMSCVTCHNPKLGFTDGKPKSMSNVLGKTVLRNSPTLLNAAYSDRYFYDLRAFTLEQQAEHVVFNPDEFNTAYKDILKKLNASPVYVNKFNDVFGKGTISREKFSKALVSYVLSLKSFNSSFDKYVRNEQNAISEEVKNGFNLFMGKANCATCHFAPTFSGLVPPFYTENESEILGVFGSPNIISLDEDEGRSNNQIKSEKAWIYEKSFKTTTVRNVELTSPYFHNGAYNTLEEVLDFYNNGGGKGRGIEVQNQTLPEDKLDLSEKEIKELIAFMKSLTDNSLGNN